MRDIIKELLRDKIRRVVSFIILFIVFIGLFAGVIASDRSSALIPFGPQTAKGSMTSYQPPGFQEVMPDGRTLTHILGTDEIGRDVASRLLHGINTALIVGIFSTLISLIIALMLGVLAGYYGNDQIRVNLYALIWAIIIMIVGSFFIQENSYSYDDNQVLRFEINRCLIWIVTLFIGLIFFLKGTARLSGRTIQLPLDNIVLRLLEVFKSIPALFLLLSLYALITQPSIWIVVFLIGMLRWGTMTRLIRAEIIRVKQDNYIKNAAILGLGDLSIIYRHVLPAVIGPLMVAISFSIGAAILIESTLSFLQIGLPISEVSLGKMLSQSRNYFNAWWLAIPPGIIIFLFILLFNLLGDRIETLLRAQKR